MSAQRTGSLASSRHSSANSHRSPATRNALLALASATKRRIASSACRPIGAYSPVKESERPMVIFTKSGSDFRDAALDDGLSVGIERFVGENLAAVASVFVVRPEFGGDGLAGQHWAREAHTQAFQPGRVAIA